MKIKRGLNEKLWIKMHFSITSLMKISNAQFKIVMVIHFCAICYCLCLSFFWIISWFIATKVYFFWTEEVGDTILNFYASFCYNTCMKAKSSCFKSNIVWFPIASCFSIKVVFFLAQSTYNSECFEGCFKSSFAAAVVACLQLLSSSKHLLALQNGYTTSHLLFASTFEGCPIWWMQWLRKWTSSLQSKF